MRPARRSRSIPRGLVPQAAGHTEAVSLAARLHDEGYGCALTAVYSPAQALLAHEAGCAWVIPYASAARHSAGHVVELAAGARAVGSETRVLAASLKTSQQVTDAVLDGADDVTAPLDVIRALRRPLTESAVREFAAHWE